jgi:hypothetical protein
MAYKGGGVIQVVITGTEQRLLPSSVQYLCPALHSVDVYYTITSIGKIETLWVKTYYLK